MIVPLFVGREKSMRALEEVMQLDKTNPARHPETMRVTTIPSADSIFLRSGTVATILQLLKLPDGTVKVLVEGKAQRATIVEYTENARLLPGHRRTCFPRTIAGEEDAVEIEALVALGRHRVRASYIKLNKKVPPEVRRRRSTRSRSYSKLADTVASHLSPSRFPRSRNCSRRMSDPERLEKALRLHGRRNLASCRLRSASARASSARWRRPSASII